MVQNERTWIILGSHNFIVIRIYTGYVISALLDVRTILMSETVLTYPPTWEQGYKLGYIENGRITFIGWSRKFPEMLALYGSSYRCITAV